MAMVTRKNNIFGDIAIMILLGMMTRKTTGWWFFTNPSEKILAKMGSSSPIFGVEIKDV